jgi:hypothetical protein
MSNPFRADPKLDSLRFFAVPSQWFLRAWPILTARSPDVITDENWRESIGWIQNVELIDDSERDVPSDEEESSDNGLMNNINNNNEDGGLQPHHQQQQQQQQQTLSQNEQNRVRIHRLHKRMARKRQTTHTFKAGLVHTEHYFFLGPSAWMLVKSKFGFDGYELSRPCVAKSIRGTIAISLHPINGHDTTSSGGVGPTIQTLDGSSIPTIQIPSTGRFPYEKVVAKYKDNTNSNYSRNFDSSRLNPPEAVFDDGDDGDDGRNNSIVSVCAITLMKMNRLIWESQFCIPMRMEDVSYRTLHAINIYIYFPSSSLLGLLGR